MTLQCITVADVIRAKKKNVEIGNWEKGAVPRARFPLKRKKLHLGPGWKWRIATFSAFGEEFYVLIMLNSEKEIYRSILAMKSGNILRVLCSHELHTSHFNWHCHFVRGNIYDVHPGVLQDRDRTVRWPNFSSSECTQEFNITEREALAIAVRRYRFEKSDEGQLI